MELEQLETTLDTERDILLTGQLDKLTALLPIKEAAIKDLAALSDPIPERIRSKLERNQALLQASAEGIQNVQSKLKEFRHVRDCLSFYGPNGSKTDHSLSGARHLFKRS